MKTHCLALLAPLLAALAACDSSESTMVRYEAVDAYSWDAAERLDFDLGPVPASGNYGLVLHVRTTSAAPFPFKTLYVEVQRRQNGSGIMATDTVACRFSEKEHSTSGITLHQYAFPIARLHCHAADSLHFTVRHLMRQEEITGIDNVGIALSPR